MPVLNNFIYMLCQIPDLLANIAQGKSHCSAEMTALPEHSFLFCEGNHILGFSSCADFSVWLTCRAGGGQHYLE